MGWNYPKGQPLPDCNLIPAAGASGGKTSSASCGPTPGWPGPSDSLGRKSSALFTAQSIGFGLAPIPPSGKAAGRRGRRFYEPQKQRPFVRTLFAVAASGECNELRRVAVRRVGWRRTARLCESQKLGSKHRPVSASLRLRLRSAAFPSPAGISSRFCSPQNERNPYFRRGARRPTGGYCARAARAPRPVDRKCLRISTGSLYPRSSSAFGSSFVRAPGEILSKRACTF